MPSAFTSLLSVIVPFLAMEWAEARADVLRSPDVEMLLLPLVRAADPAAYGDPEERFHKTALAAKACVEGLQKLADESNPVDAPAVRELADEIAVPFRARLVLRERQKLLAQRDEALRKFEDYRRNPPYSSVTGRVFWDAQHMNLKRQASLIEGINGQLEQMNREAVGMLIQTNRKIAKHLEAERTGAVQALANCLFVNQSRYELELPFEPAISEEMLEATRP